MEIECLGDQDVIRFLEGRSDKTEIDRIDFHLDKCLDCRQIIGALGSNAETYCHNTSLQPGEKLASYTILRRVGRGAMGEVYEAEDESLQRQVALKLIHAVDSKDSIRDEARVIAQINHPNVVTVYEVGEHQGILFIAMEFVIGQTLSEWIEKDHPLSSLLDVLIQAGDGLYAAHRSDIVHRDFKPDNILVGEDGRVRVTDFGLATPESESFIHGTSQLRDPLVSSKGELIGTPAYMSPEQFRGEKATHLSDQFAFGIVCWEVLFKQMPFSGQSIEALSKAVIDGQMRGTQTGNRKNRQLKHVFAKMLSSLDTHRFESMSQVLLRLREIQKPPIKRKALLAASAIGVSAALMFSLQNKSAPAVSCDQGNAQIAPIWNQNIKASLTANLESKSNWQDAIQNIDNYSEQWAQSADAACHATHIDGSQSSELLDRRQLCLDSKKNDFSGLIHVLQAGEPIKNVLSATKQLPSIDECEDTQRLLSLVPPPATQVDRERLAHIEKKLAETYAFQTTGDTPQAIKNYPSIIQESEDFGYKPLLAKALFRYGDALSSERDQQKTKEVVERALTTATAAGDDHLAAEAAIQLFSTIGFSKGTEAAQIWGELASASIDRTGNDPSLRSDLMLRQAEQKQKDGKSEEALRLFRECCALRERVSGSNDISQFACQTGAGQSASSLNLIDESIKHNEKAIEVVKAHGTTKGSLIGMPLISLADSYAELGDYPHAIQSASEALALFIGEYGEGHPWVAYARVGLGYHTLKSGKAAESISHLEKAVEENTATLGADHLNTAYSVVGLADALFELGQIRRSYTLYKSTESVLATLEAASETELRVAKHLGLGRIALLKSKTKQAEFELSAAVELLEQSTVSPYLSGRAYFELAKLSRLQKKNEQANELARLALLDFKKRDALSKEEGAVRIWLDKI